jgi:Spy/CpxP family protein refolding chaperone
MKTAMMTTILAAMMIAGTVVAQPSGRQGQFGNRFQQQRGDAHDELIAQLDLTAEQETALKGMRDSFQSAMIDLRANVEKARLKVRSAMDSDDKEAVLSALQAESDAQLELKKARVGFQYAVDDVLGPEKAAQLKELRAEYREERRANRQGNRGPKDGQGRGKGGNGGDRGNGGPQGRGPQSGW